MYVEPLFVRFLNGTAGLVDVCRSLQSCRDEKTAIMAKEVAEFPRLYQSSLEDFRPEFRKCVEDMIDNGLSKNAREFLSAYTSQSLVEFSNDSSFSFSGSRETWVAVSNQESQWAEAIICYGLMLFIKVGRLADLKKCSKCGKYFSHKGKYAKYCSEICKGKNKE